MAGIPSVGQSATAMVHAIHGIAEGSIPQRAQIGVVISPPPEIEIRLNDIPLTKKDIYISSYLLSGYTRHVKGETSDAGGGSGDAAYESHRHPVDNDETWTDTLRPGDLVSVIPIEGDQLYIITDKVVRL